MRDIFQRVDNAFKIRKRENQILAMQVSELENHLQYLENQTQDQVTATALLGLALSNSTKSVTNVETQVNDLAEHSTKLIEQTANDYKNAVQQSK